MVPEGQEPSMRSMRLLNYARYAEAHDWTPEQVDRTPAWIIRDLIPVENAIREVRHEQQR